MKRKARIFLCVILSWMLLGENLLSAYAEETYTAEEMTNLAEAPSVVLMEAVTGKILYEKDKDARRSPASITKIMTLILIFDAIYDGKLKLDDLVTTSAYAKSMGGSQVFLEEGEQQDVETLIKCIVIASGNDASVSMAEHIAGSEAGFVALMNERAAGLGMKNTHFEDCCGLSESENHYTSAYDVALMSRELITRYPEILKYSSIWMDTITHVTRQGSSEFGLTNTNKLLRSYEGCQGLKTGSTSLAKYCFSGVAERNGIMLLASVMAAADPKGRFRDAASMLNYGFSRCRLYTDSEKKPLQNVSVRFGMNDVVPVSVEKEFQYLRTDGEEITGVKKKLELPGEIKAPVKKGDTVGELCYYMEDVEIGKVQIVCDADVEKATYRFWVKKIFEAALM